MASRWPSELLLPALVAAIEAAAVAPLVHVLGAAFASTGADGAPWPAALAILGLAAFWSTRLLAGLGVALRTARALSLVLWIALTLIWLGAQYEAPHDAVEAIPRALGDLTRAAPERELMLFAAVLALVAWWRGLGYGSDAEPFTPERLRRLVRGAWLILTAELVVAAIGGGEGATRALGSGRLAVPVAITAGLLAVAAGQIEQARRTAISRGGRAPGRGSWLAFAGLAAVLIMVGAVLIGGLLGEETWQILYTPIVTGLRWLSLALFYLLLAVAFVLFLLLSPLIWLARLAIGRGDAPDQPPAIANPPDFSRFEDRAEGGLSPEVALALRGALVVVVSVVALLFLLSALRRYRSLRREEEVEEQRESLWSRDLALGQLRRAFARRRAARVAAIRVDLTKEPASVRDAYRYLTVLAARNGIGRQPAESAIDFSTRVSQAWPDVALPVADLTEIYLRVRYGEQPDEPERPQARADWTMISRRLAGDGQLRDRAKGHD